MKPGPTVVKFGGTSVASMDGWRCIAERSRRLAGGRVWIVVSALTGVTNRLEEAVREARSGHRTDAAREIRTRHEELAQEAGLGAEGARHLEPLFDDLDRWLSGITLTQDTTPRIAARILATGELASSRLGARILERLGVPARWVDSRELLVSETRPAEPAEIRYLHARVPCRVDPDLARERSAGAPVVIVPGFVGSTPEGETCVLGRGGSDTSAALLAALMEARELEIWTDVPGMFTADPQIVPAARLIRTLGYREAEELAALGAKVLHPLCIPPVAQARIPLTIHNTMDASMEGTRIEATTADHPTVTAVTRRLQTTLVTLSTAAMWEAPGFLAQVFEAFSDLGISVDHVATSETSISLTLDRIPGGKDGPAFAELVLRLEGLGKVAVIHPCAVVSLVGRRIRSVLHELGPAMEVFRERPVHLVTNSSEDLNLSFVVEEQDAVPLVRRLHERLFASAEHEPRLGPSWEILRGADRAEEDRRPWWRDAREELLRMVSEGGAVYVYHLPTVTERATELRRKLPAVSEFFYSIKANRHPAVLQRLASLGFGMECVSMGEVLHVREVLGTSVPVLFTPNFCHLEEFAGALERGAEIVVDGPQIFDQGGDLFRGRRVGLRLDPGFGHGHHDKVRTAGAGAKFGQPLDEIGPLVDAASRAGAVIVGLHAHVGSGVHDVGAWVETARALSGLADAFPDLGWIDLGGGLGVPERPGQAPLDLEALGKRLGGLLPLPKNARLRLEPGRFLVSEAGVLLVEVTQVRTKGKTRFAGVATGMNSLLRPALYGSWHRILDLTRCDEAPSGQWHVVGPICETSDVLGRDRWLPAVEPGDILLIENAGAYGAVMSSRYNMREPAEERILAGPGDN